MSFTFHLCATADRDGNITVYVNGEPIKPKFPFPQDVDPAQESDDDE